MCDYLTDRAAEPRIGPDELYRGGKPYRDSAAAFRALSEELSGIVRRHPSRPAMQVRAAGGIDGPDQLSRSLGQGTSALRHDAAVRTPCAGHRVRVPKESHHGVK
jgi:hypothetical protein